MDDKDLIPAAEVACLLDSRTSRHPSVTISAAAALAELSEGLASYAEDQWSLHDAEQAADVLGRLAAAVHGIARATGSVAEWLRQHEPESKAWSLLLAPEVQLDAWQLDAALTVLAEIPPSTEDYSTLGKVMDGIAAALERRGYTVALSIEDTCTEPELEDACCSGCTIDLAKAPLADGRELEIHYFSHDARWGLLLGGEYSELHDLGCQDVHPGQVIEAANEALDGQWPAPAHRTTAPSQSAS